MKRFLTHIAIVFVGVIFNVNIVLAQNDKVETLYNPIHTAMVCNTIAPDARSGGMGDVGAATDPDAVSQYWNPAKYPFCISRAGVQISYTPWLRQLVSDMNLAHVAGYYRIGERSAISSSLQYFSLGEVYTSEDESATTIKPYELSFDVGYSMMLSEKFSLGAAVRVLLSDMAWNTASQEKSIAAAFAADIAGYYQTYFNIGNRECQWAIGFNFRNIGSKIKTDPNSDYSEFIPATMRIGTSLMVPINEYNRISFSVDANKLLVPTYPTEEQWKNAVAAGETQAKDLRSYAIETYYSISSMAGIFKSFGDASGGAAEEFKEVQWSFGAEYVYNDRFAIRAGYHDEAESKGNRKYFTVGAGFRMSAFTLDAAYVIATAKSNPLDQTLRFSLNFDIDGIRDLFHRR